jgi:hypothetical protein
MGPDTPTSHSQPFFNLSIQTPDALSLATEVYFWRSASNGALITEKSLMYDL